MISDRNFGLDKIDISREMISDRLFGFDKIDISREMISDRLFVFDISMPASLLQPTGGVPDV